MDLTKEDIWCAIRGYESKLYRLADDLANTGFSDEVIERKYNELKEIRQRIKELKEMEKEM